MIRIMNSKNCTRAQLLERTLPETPSVDAAVRQIIENVRQNGDKALLEYAEKFDGAKLEKLEVTAEEWEAGVALVDADFMETLRQAKANIAAFHSRQKRTDFAVTDQPGILLGQRILPLEKVGVYVPGGTASYPSTVLMDTIPARIAGVGQIIMVTPPDENGAIAPEILAAAKLAGVDRIFKTGGAGAVAALAYGTESVPQVDKIVGPGNVFVATAKRMVFGQVAIDMVAGPSEILVLADGDCDPAWVAADLLSQAEHDKLASAILVTESEELAQKVQNELERQLALLPRGRIARESIDQNGRIIITQSREESVELANAYAPEHLELCVEDPFALLPLIRNAGSVFLGKNVPEALGDYFAGPNHTLPTSGTARFASPLGVDDFVKRSSFIYYSNEALGKVADRIVDFAAREGLDAHGRSVAIRFEK